MDDSRKALGAAKYVLVDSICHGECMLWDRNGQESRCPYYEDDNCYLDFKRDLLEKVEPVEPEYGTESGRPVYKCGACGDVIYCISQYSPAEMAKDHAKFCHNCGKAVKWDG